MSNRSYSYDVVVVGGGLAGIFAAAGAQALGARVALLTDGKGMLELTTGCIDLLGATPAGQAVSRPWEALNGLASEDPGHPYALLGADAVREGLNAFRSALAEMGCDYQETADLENQWIATALGHLRPTYLVPTGIAAPRQGEPVRVIGLRGMKEFHPAVFAEGLRRSLPETPVSWEWAELPPNPLAGLTDLNPIQVARLMDDAQYRAQVIRNLGAAGPAAPAPALVLFPAVLGLNRPGEVRAAFSKALGAPVREIPLMSPSLPGLRMANLLNRYLEQHQVDIYSTLRVTGATVESGRVTAVTGEAAGREMAFRAKSFVLATGGLLGKGFQVDGKRLQEPIFNLAVEAPEDGSDQWVAPELMPVGGHPFVRCGVRTDRQLRPEGWANLHICGRMLAGYDPYAACCGGGVAVASGWRAGQLAGGAVQ